MSAEVVSLQVEQRRPVFVRPVPRVGVGESELFDRAAEQSVLAAPLLAGDLDAELSRQATHAVLERILTILGPESFFEPRHADILRAMVAVRDLGEPIDLVTVSAALRRAERLNAVGGAAYLGELTEALPTIAHVDAHARIVAEHASRRMLVAYAARLRDRALDLGSSLADVRDRAAEAIRTLPVPGRVARPIGEDLEPLRAHMDRQISGAELPAVSTGLKDLDALLGGGYRVGVHYLVARPRVGKTALATQIAVHVARTEGPAYILSKEIVRQELLRVMVAQVGRIGVDRLQQPALMTERDHGCWYGAAREISRLPIAVQDDAEPGCPRTVGELGAAIQAWSVSLGRKPRLVVVDHLLKLRSSRRLFDRRMEVEDISEGLRLLALRLEIPILVLLHVKRISKDRGLWRIPTLEDAAESDAPARDARSVFILHREDFYPTKKYPEDQPPMAGLVDVFAPKVRGAESMKRARLRFNGGLQHWTGVEAESGFDDQPGPSAHAAASSLDQDFTPEPF